MNKITLVTLAVLPLMVMADMDKCVSCHGVDFEKSALGASKIVKNMTEAEIKASLDGYKMGKGGSMKEVMIKEVNVGVDTDAMAADVYNEIITPGFEEPDAEFIFKKRRTVRGLHKIKQALKKADSKELRAKSIAKIKAFAFDIYTYDKSLRASIDMANIKPKKIETSDILKQVAADKSCTDHSFTEEALLKCRTSFVTLASELSLQSAKKLQKKIKPKDKKKTTKNAAKSDSADGLVTMKLFESKCSICHITDMSKMKDKSSFIAPPADEIMVHMKEEFKQKDKAVKFMASYILAPDPAKAKCASIEYFGIMPPQKEAITEKQAQDISAMMYDVYPRDTFPKDDIKGHMTFEKLDENADGSISAQEFQHFRAKKNKIDPNKFVNTFYFDRLDLNHDKKMDKDEFAKMKADKMSKK